MNRAWSIPLLAIMLALPGAPRAQAGGWYYLGVYGGSVVWRRVGLVDSWSPYETANWYSDTREPLVLTDFYADPEPEEPSEPPADDRDELIGVDLEIDLDTSFFLGEVLLEFGFTGDLGDGVRNQDPFSTDNGLYSPPIPGDGNGDGRVDIGDFTIWAARVASGDFNDDGAVDILDFDFWESQFRDGRVTPTTITTLASATPIQSLKVELKSSPVDIGMGGFTKLGRDFKYDDGTMIGPLPSPEPASALLLALGALYLLAARDPLRRRGPG